MRPASRYTCARLWPTSAEIDAAIRANVTPELFKENYAALFDGDETWQSIHSLASDLYAWQPDSTYIQEPPFFDLSFTSAKLGSSRLRVLAVLGES